MHDLQAIHPFLADHHQEVAREAASFAEREIAPLPHRHEDAKARLQARQILSLLGKGGWCRYSIPEAFGGQATGPDLRSCCLIREALAGASPLADSVFALQCLGSMPTVLAGSKGQKERYLPEVAGGRLMTAFAMTEPEAGSDVASMSTRAVRDGSGYVLDGRKHLITNAGVADLYTIFAVTDPEAGSRGLTCFLVEADQPGFHFVEAQVLSEPHPLGVIAFEGCHLKAESRLGAEGEGFKIGMRTLDRLRSTVAAAACGMADRALHEALQHGKRRTQFGRPLAEFQLTQQKLARSATDLTAARLLTYRAAAAVDGGAPRVTLEAAMAKLFATETAQRVVDDAVQILGGRGVLRDSPVDRLYRAVRALRIYEGTSEVQHLVIARQLLADIS
jgi:acyl-CoA dehydrogenase